MSDCVTAGEWVRDTRIEACKVFATVARRARMVDTLVEIRGIGERLACLDPNSASASKVLDEVTVALRTIASILTDVEIGGQS